MTHTQINWATTMAEARPLYEAWGASVVAAIHGLCPRATARAARRYGVDYKGPAIGQHSLSIPERVTLARAWLAGGAAGIPGAAQVTRRVGLAPTVIVADVCPRDDAVVITPTTVRITRAPAPVDRRFAPDPGFQRLFSTTAPGVDPMTKEAWR